MKFITLLYTLHWCQYVGNLRLHNTLQTVLKGGSKFSFLH